jgi:hypothetical protein
MNAQVRTRIDAANNLCAAIAACEPTDAAQIMAAALQDMETDGPQHDVFGTLRRDAAFWAELAPVHEVQAYVLEGLKKLGQRALAPNARKALIVDIWRGMTPEDKREFLKRLGVVE